MKTLLTPDEHGNCLAAEDRVAALDGHAMDADAPDRVVGIPEWVQDAGLLDAIAAAVVATDPTGKIFYFNQAAERMYGYSADVMLGGNVMQLLVEPVDQIPASEIMATVLAGNRWSGHFRVRRKAGDTAVVRTTDTPIMEGGRVVGVIGVAEDIADDPTVDQAAITARIEYKAVQLADQMRQAMETRAVIDQAKGMLIAAHGCSPDEAFQMLSAHSQRTNRKLREIATAMVEGARRTRTLPAGESIQPRPETLPHA